MEIERVAFLISLKILEKPLIFLHKISQLLSVGNVTNSKIKEKLSEISNFLNEQLVDFSILDRFELNDEMIHKVNNLEDIATVFTDKIKNFFELLDAKKKKKKAVMDKLEVKFKELVDDFLDYFNKVLKAIDDMLKDILIKENTLMEYRGNYKLLYMFRELLKEYLSSLKAKSAAMSIVIGFFVFIFSFTLPIFNFSFKTILLFDVIFPFIVYFGFYYLTEERKNAVALIAYIDQFEI